MSAGDGAFRQPLVSEGLRGLVSICPRGCPSWSFRTPCGAKLGQGSGVQAVPLVSPLGRCKVCGKGLGRKEAVVRVGTAFPSQFGPIFVSLRIPKELFCFALGLELYLLGKKGGGGYVVALR